MSMSPPPPALLISDKLCRFSSSLDPSTCYLLVRIDRIAYRPQLNVSLVFSLKNNRGPTEDRGMGLLQSSWRCSFSCRCYEREVWVVMRSAVECNFYKEWEWTLSKRVRELSLWSISVRSRSLAGTAELETFTSAFYVWKFRGKQARIAPGNLETVGLLPPPPVPPFPRKNWGSRRRLNSTSHMSCVTPTRVSGVFFLIGNDVEREICYRDQSLLFYLLFIGQKNYRKKTYLELKSFWISRIFSL